MYTHFVFYAVIVVYPLLYVYIENLHRPIKKNQAFSSIFDKTHIAFKQFWKTFYTTFYILV